jgi:hypothetical protein
MLGAGLLRTAALAAVLATLAALTAASPADAKLPSPPIETFRISGGDLPHPIVVSVAEYQMATTGQESWYTHADLPAPTASQPRYELDVIDAETPSAPPLSSMQFVLGPPPLIAGQGVSGWAEPIPDVVDLIDRYILLGKGGLLSEQPTLAEALAASEKALGASATAGGVALTSSQAADFVALLGQAQPVRFGVRGTLIGSRDLHPVPLVVAFGGTKLHVTYVPPGPVAPYGLLFDDRRVGNWEYVTLLNPPGYAQDAYTVPREFDAFMSALGFKPSPAGEIIEDRVVPLQQARFAFGIDHIEAWRDGAPHVTLPAESDEAIEAPCTLPSDCSRSPVPPSSGPSLNLQVWPRGIDPFPEAVSPAEYVYYPHDAAGSALGVLVGKRDGAVANGTFGAYGPAYAGPALDAQLKALLAGPPARGPHLRTAIAVAVPAVLLGLAAIAYVSWDAERKRRRAAPE